MPLATAPETQYTLLIEPDTAMRRVVEDLLLKQGYRVTAVAELSRAAGLLDQQRHDLVIASLAWPETVHAQRVRALRRAAGELPLVLMCPRNRVDQAVLALRLGVDDYVLRPPDPVELQTRLVRILERRDLDSRLHFFQDELSKKAGFKSFEARSPAMRLALERVRRVAPMRSTVLIFGESGVGKELVARSIHFNSRRSEGPFIALNCAAMPASLIESELFGHEKGSFTGAHSRTRGKFEIAHQGTLFLDEIGEMTPSIQAKLLRVLEEREFMRVGGDRSIRVDVRVIAATNADLERMVSESSFRSDLYYRLKVVTITVPPLRERREDLPPLVETFLDDLSKDNAVPRKSVTPEALGALQTYPWPGNVRELKNILESILVSVPGNRIELEDLPQPVRQSGSSGSLELEPGMTLEGMERELIRNTLEHTGGNRTHSASLLGIGVRTLQRKIRSYEIDVPPTRRRPRQRLQPARGSG